MVNEATRIVRGKKIEAVFKCQMLDGGRPREKGIAVHMEGGKTKQIPRLNDAVRIGTGS